MRWFGEADATTLRLASAGAVEAPGTAFPEAGVPSPVFHGRVAQIPAYGGYRLPVLDTPYVIAVIAFFVLVAWIARPREREAAPKRPARGFEPHLEELPQQFHAAADAERLAAFLRQHGHVAIAKVVTDERFTHVYKVVVGKFERSAVDDLLAAEDPFDQPAEGDVSTAAIEAELAAPDDDDDHVDEPAARSALRRFFDRLFDWRTVVAGTLLLVGAALAKRWLG